MPSMKRRDDVMSLLIMQGLGEDQMYSVLTPTYGEVVVVY